MLVRLITFLQVSKNNTTPSLKEKLGSYEKQIVSFLNPSKFRRPIPNLQLGQVPQPPVPQLQSHENQLNPQLQSMNVHGSIPMMQQNNMSSLQLGSLSSLSGVSMSQPNTMCGMRDF
jgi:PAX-interacting protein 1